ncbi:adenine deaminase [Brevibacillus sp. SYSU BS000544]|uniref:adenine deaminase n=1 Tax=Brevibacillus sp. SYSU BS000544 TaxID=3416443 RepID=UPI003CE5761E
MSMDKALLKKRIAVASKKIPADLVIQNGRIIDVFNREIVIGDIAIADGYFVGIGQYEGHHTIDARNRYVSPAFIDAHVHIESSMVTPSEFAKVVLPHGVTTVITDPHEIANVSGVDGIQYMIDDSEKIPLDVFIMLPSCVPATPFENAGAELKAEHLAPFLSHPRVLGLAEVMDYPSVLQGKDDMLDKLISTTQHGKLIDGHAAGLDSDSLNVYASAGIRTDHECTTVADAQERIRRGMYLLIREGSAAKDLDSLIPVITEKNARRCLFCTDDKHLDDLLEEGSIDHNVRLAIKRGVDPLLAIQIASLHTAECYGLRHKGAIAPGYEADFILLDDIDTVTISEVYKAGELVARNGSYVGKAIHTVEPPPHLKETVHLSNVEVSDLQIPIGATGEAHIIEIIPNRLITRKIVEKVPTVEGYFTPSIENDQLKIAVIERHRNTGNIGLGIVKGFGLTQGAIASTVGHDSHNIIVVGTNDQDMIQAVQTIQRMNGGLVVQSGKDTCVTLPLPIAGLLSDQDNQTLLRQLSQIDAALEQVGFRNHFNPFLTMSFLSLPVIPELKLTDLGLFDVKSFTHITTKLS